jgi:hypothetical protein
MSFPGSNLLTDAMALIETIEVKYVKDAGRQLNDQGMWVTAYNDPVLVEASVQAPDRNTYIKYGLDMQKNYLKIFLSLDTIDLSRDKSGDQFIIGEQGGEYRYQLESEIPWFPYDGWVEVFVVQIGREPTI